ncbi:MAG: preprotein translocase subunit SecE [Rickettsiales bacterium]|nr:preprotein translocase subunit SecE [Rickettsiales bacterium]
MTFNIKLYFKEVVGEYKRIIFPTKDDVVKTSIYICVIVFLTACVIWLSDFLISNVMKVIFGLN